MAERKTDRQHAIMAQLASGTMDMDQLLAALPEIPSKQAAQCSVRFLESHGCLERRYELRRGRKRMVLSLTAYGLTAFNLSLASAAPVSPGTSFSATLGASPVELLPEPELSDLSLETSELPDSVSHF